MQIEIKNVHEFKVDGWAQCEAFVRKNDKTVIFGFSARWLSAPRRGEPRWSWENRGATFASPHVNFSIQEMQEISHAVERHFA